MSGIFNHQRPQKEKYTFLRDVEVVLEYLGDLPENNLLSDKTLTRNLLFLLALTSALTASEMTNLGLNIYQSHKKVLFYAHRCRIKTGEKGRHQSKFSRRKATMRLFNIRHLFGKE